MKPAIPTEHVRGDMRMLRGREYFIQSGKYSLPQINRQIAKDLGKIETNIPRFNYRQTLVRDLPLPYLTLLAYN